MKKLMWLVLLPFANIPPTCVVTAPTNNQIIKVGEAVVINVTAKDSDGTISKVEIFNGSTVISTQRSVPYTTTIKNIQPGAYALKARATDNQGGVKTSTVVMIYVLNVDYAKEIDDLKMRNKSLSDSLKNLFSLVKVNRDSIIKLRKDYDIGEAFRFWYPLRASRDSIDKVIDVKIIQK